nr:hypothetical protein [Tanacetum cinerariifolium]
MAEMNPEGPKWPNQVDIPENDEQEETLEQTKTDEHENAHIPEELISNFAGRVKEVTYSDFSTCALLSYSEGSNPFLWNEFKELFLQKFSPPVKLKNIRRDFLSTHHATQKSVHDFSMTFLDRARFLPKYINDQKLLMEHYVDMLRKEIHEFILAKDWKNMDELMNAALEREQETKKRGCWGKGYPQCANYGKFHPGECRAGNRTCFSCSKHGHISKKCHKPAQICKKCSQPNHTAESCLNTQPPPPPRQQEPRRHMNRCGAPPAPKPREAPSFARVQRPQRPLGRVFEIMTVEDAKEAHDIVTCTFFVNLLPARVLFDSEELPGIPHERHLEFPIGLISRSTSIAKSPYILAPSEMQDLMKQLQELLDKGFICPSSSS